MLDDTIEVTVGDLVDEAIDIKRFVLHRTGNLDFPTWTPGAHIDVLFAEGLVRQYSLCGDPHRADIWEIAVLHTGESRGASHYLHTQINIGDRLSIRGPRNNFKFNLDSSLRFLAAGVGITPIISMIRAAHSADVKWRLDYISRSRKRMAFLEELESYSSNVVVHASDEGRVFKLKHYLIDTGGVYGAPLYACGPARLLDELTTMSETWPEDYLHIERFRPKSDASLPDRHSFTVNFALSGVTAQVNQRETILDVAEQSGILVVSSCREGTCGTCETDIIEGEADHRDSVLSAAEQAQQRTMMICCSRSKGSNLVLDL
ncbi:PDR/VanB family oxidoreductase [Nesterenkonia ebinurensis]|uniref:PDR/VanB family oxidoreductase n=1 Tax=Nesterenkonia ebinurensis TaxID=2608252 RepID=UPI00123CCF71|nr:PDR/VanB family oxidoreductase [Nesterenkonia ebinurensis]